MSFAPVSTITGVVAPLPLANIDTDVIIRIERLTVGDPAELGRWAFESLRYLPDGSENPTFPLNRPEWRDAPIMIAGRNFGCGSSREGAVTAMLAMGLRCVIAESFGDIFYNNCFQSGLLPVRVTASEIDQIMALAEQRAIALSVDLRSGSVRLPDGSTIPFAIDGHRREAMLAGLDDVALTMRDIDAIADWQQSDSVARPWVWQIVDQHQEMADDAKHPSGADRELDS
ncbi:3-isopropylmalate dehydratase small subunit [Tsuneonella suprasediminis]|uniref:3-isopropylmalate dehydratase n=1 Tax=Tsuneonella suprasediminis TaxID=2306996 RepID=A0A419R3Y1_9SPHN|nr:3-isopropylmalate dehydratase small subunit [Tsuneonella suprasediminis]RJX69126.1 3-isopropylmalate dehydratase small subunit [Tsuneonella suprasediminis]